MFEHIGEAVEPAAAVVLTLAGALAELTASQWLMAGDTVVGLWLVYMGGIALYTGLFVVGGGLTGLVGAEADGAD